jgi:hypothetical protein
MLTNVDLEASRANDFVGGPADRQREKDRYCWPLVVLDEVDRNL